MMETNLLDICVDSGDCPLCLAKRLEELGIDTFSSVEKMKEICGDLGEARNPFAYRGTWFYVCADHLEEDWSIEELEATTIDFSCLSYYQD